MRDPFNAPADLLDTDRRVGNELTRTNVTLSARDYVLQNGDAKPFVPSSDTLVRQGASLHDDLIAEDPSTRFMDPETKELYFRSRTQEEEILLLRKQIADESSKELQLLSEKHILERKLADLRMAVDERQEDAISGALKQLNEKRNHIEENMRLSNDLKVQEEELYLFTSSLLGMLAEYNVRPPQIYASTITTVTKRLYQQMQWKIRSLNDSLGDTTQPGDIYNPNHQQATPSRNEPSSSYNMEPNRNTFPHYAQDSNDRHAEQMYRSTFNQDIVSATPSNYFQENAGPREARLDDDSQFYRNDNQEYSADGDPLPGIEGFQIIGEPRPGSNLTACGFPTNGTTLCNFQWVRCLEDGTRQSIEGATMYDYVVTADDVGTLLAVDCTPMDDNGRQGDLVRKFANDENKISCDPDMQNDINICISRGRADFDVYVLAVFSELCNMLDPGKAAFIPKKGKPSVVMFVGLQSRSDKPRLLAPLFLMNGNSPEEWELATLVLKRTGYQINLSNKDEVFMDEKYSPNLEARIPNGRTTQFVLVSSGGLNLPFNTQGITEPNSEDNDVRLRDLIVLVMRTFQNKALDAKRKGKA